MRKAELIKKVGKLEAEIERLWDASRAEPKHSARRACLDLHKSDGTTESVYYYADSTAAEKAAKDRIAREKMPNRDSWYYHDSGPRPVIVGYDVYYETLEGLEPAFSFKAEERTVHSGRS